MLGNTEQENAVYCGKKTQALYTLRLSGKVYHFDLNYLFRKWYTNSSKTACIGKSAIIMQCCRYYSVYVAQIFHFIQKISKVTIFHQNVSW